MLLYIWSAFRHLLIGLVVVAVVTAPWSLMAVANLRLSPHVPWAIPIGLTYVAFLVAYLNGRGWPASTAEIRRRRFRARLLSWEESRWSLLAGASAIMCLWLVFAAFGNFGTQSSPGREATLPAAILSAFVIVGSAITALGEEGGLRGFMQAPLEQRFGPVVAIVTTTVVFVLIHASRGLPVLVRTGPFYLAAGVVYGLLAYLTQSILPALVLHFLGDVVTFGLRSSLIHLPGPHTGAAITLCIVGAAVAGGLSIVAFRRLAAVSASTRIARVSDLPADPAFAAVGRCDHQPPRMSRGRQRDCHMNAIVAIHPYKYQGLWVFDDATAGLAQEPFVSGADEIIDKMVQSIPGAESGFTLLFSATPFPGCQTSFEWRRQDLGGNWYYSVDLGIEGWLCPALFRYFDAAPERIYAQFKPKAG